MRLLAVLLAATLVLTACGKSSTPPTASSDTLPTLVSTGSISNIDALGVSALAGYLGATPIVPLVEIPVIPTNEGNLGLTLWGTKDASGTITALAQAQVQGIGGTGSVHVFFDQANLPVYFRDDASGYGIVVSNESSSNVTFTLCDGSGNADSSVTMSNLNGTVSAGSVTDGGTCTLRSANALRRAPHATTSWLTYTNISSLSSLTKVISAASYAAGYAFALSSILKFKQHKDNPTAVPIATPLALVVVAMALLFLPTILSIAGATTVNSASLTQIASNLPTYVSEGSLSSIFPSPDPTP